MQKKLKKISIGFIGYGNMATKRHQAIKTLKKYKTSVSYIIDKKIKEDKTNKYFKSWNKIINLKTDLIIISIQTNEVKKIPFLIFKNTKYLLIEKPISTDLNYLKKLNKFCAANKITLKTGYNLRFDNGLKMINQLMSKKSVGKLYYVKINYSNGTSRTNNNNIGSLFDIGCHSVNLLQWLLKTKNFSNYLTIIQKNEFMNRKKDDNGFVLMKYKKIAINLQFGFCSWKNTFELEIVGNKGYLRVDGLPKWGKQTISFGRRKYPSGYPYIKNWIYDNDLSFKNEMEYIFKNIFSNKFIKKVNDEGYQTVKCLKKIN